MATGEDSTWEDATDACVTAGGWLAMVETDTLLALISTELDNNEMADIDNLWIGLHQARWEWHDGKQENYFR